MSSHWMSDISRDIVRMRSKHVERSHGNWKISKQVFRDPGN